MANAAFLQTSFLGGEFSPYMQGRADDPRYKEGLNVCLNSLPIEEGACVRRPGTSFCATTRKGKPGVLKFFDFTSAMPYNMEFTDGFMRFFSGNSLVFDPTIATVLSISAANPAIVTTASAHGWTTLDEVQFALPASIPAFVGMAPLFNRQFEITVLTAYTFSIADPVTGAGIDGSTISLGAANPTVARVTTFPTVYTTGSWANNRVVQSGTQALILNNAFKPYVLTATQTPGVATAAQFTYGAATFMDGPYLDPPTDGTTLTPTGTSGTITLASNSALPINGGSGFLSTDVGRMIRLFSEPAVWASGTAYATGATVKFGGTYWSALAANTGSQPDISFTNWAISTTAAAWTWGTIASVVNIYTVTVTLATASVDMTGQPRADGPLLYALPITSWRLGAYSNTTGWPTCGAYYEGRFWLSGAIPNRVDATKVNEQFRFDPTGQDGTVADNCGMAETFASAEVNPIYWMLPTHVGLVCGTQAGEWLLQASSLNDPLTPTSIQAHRVTRYGCANIEPRDTGLSVIMVQRYGRKMLEYIADVYSGKFSGTNISITAKHLTTSGIAEIAYQRELAPVVWARCTNGSLIGCTYKRESPFGTQPASFSGWHRHVLGSGRLVESIQSGPSLGGNLDSVMLLTNDPATGIRYVEQMTTLFDEDTPITNAWFLDAGTAPMLGIQTSDGLGMNIYGYYALIGKTVSVFMGGLDCGDYTVLAPGYVYVPYGAAGGLFTAAYMASVSNSGVNFGPSSTGFHIASTTPAPPPISPTQIQSYIYTGDAPSGGGYYASIDWSGDRLFVWGGGYSYLKQLTISSAASVQEATYTAIGVTPSGGGYAPNGNLYFWDTANSVQIHQVNAVTFAPTATFGTDNSGFYSQPGNFAFPRTIAFVAGAGSSFLVSTGLTYGELSVIDLGTMSYTGINFPMPAPQNAALAPGKQETDLCTVYGISAVGSSNSASPLSLSRLSIWSAAQALAINYPRYDGAHGYASGDYVQYSGVAYKSNANSNVGHQPDISPSYWIAQSPPGMRNEILKTYIPTDIDAAWTNFAANTPISLIYDQTDGNILASFVSSDTVTHKTYLVKLRESDGTIMWKLALDNFFLPDPSSRVRNGRLNALGGGSDPHPCWTIDTLAGVATLTATCHNVLTAGGMSSDDTTGYLVLKPVSYSNDQSSTPPSPLPINNTASSLSYQYARLNMAIGPITGTTTLVCPAVGGFTFTSEGQILRRLSPPEAGSQSGPALAMTRRAHMFGALLANTQGISFGTDFTHLHAAEFKSPGGITYAANQLYSGILWTTLDDDYSFDSMLCWKVSRPFPANVLAIGTFHHTQER